jgi:predicted lipid carrier protein YhbT
MSANDLDGTMDPQEFAQLVKKTPDDELKQIMQSERRGPVLDEIFARMAGLFRPEKAGGTNAVIHWRVGDRPDGGVDTYELVIANGTCTLSPKPEHDPKVALTLGAVDFLKVVSGNANPMMLFMGGKLKAQGDLGLAANIGNLFNIPKA